MWLWESVVGNIVSFLIIIGAGAAIAYLKRKASDWFGPILYGLVASAVTAVGLFAFAAFTALPRKQVLVTPENLETNVRMWLDDFGDSVKTKPDQSFHFLLSVTLANGNPVQIGRPKANEKYILVAGTVTLAEEHRKMLAQHPAPERDQITRELAIEFARANLDFSLNDPLTKVEIDSRVPITPGLTEDEFMRHVTDVDRGMILANATIVHRLLSAPAK